MKKLLEQYVSQGLNTPDQRDLARKQFKAELRNGPAKKVYFQGHESTKYCGNFDLKRYHEAYDFDLEQQDLLQYFEDDGLVKRSSYAAFKAASGECAKYAKELGVLQFGNSDYTLINAPHIETLEEMYGRLIEEPDMVALFGCSLQDITFDDIMEQPTNCKELFYRIFGEPEQFIEFAKATCLDKQPYAVISKAVCSMFTCLVAAQFIKQRAIASNRRFGPSGNLKLSEVTADIDTAQLTPVRIRFRFLADGVTTQLGKEIKLALRVATVKEDTELLDMQVYANYGNWHSRYSDSTDLIKKFSDVSFDKISQITNWF